MSLQLEVEQDEWIQQIPNTLRVFQERLVWKERVRTYQFRNV